MDSLLYIGAGDDDDDESDGEEEAGPAASSSAAASLDYAALQRAGYDGTSADLSQTATYKRLDAEAKQKLEQDATAKEDEEAAAAAVEEARLAAERAMLDTKVGSTRDGTPHRPSPRIGPNPLTRIDSLTAAGATCCAAGYRRETGLRETVRQDQGGLPHEREAEAGDRAAEQQRRLCSGREAEVAPRHDGQLRQLESWLVFSGLRSRVAGDLPSLKEIRTGDCKRNVYYITSWRA